MSTIACECGSVLCNKTAYKNHLKTIKHRIFIGEDIKPKPRTGSGRPVDKTKIWYLMNLKTDEMTPEQLAERRTYVSSKLRDFRARKKEAKIQAALTQDNDVVIEPESFE